MQVNVLQCICYIALCCIISENLNLDVNNVSTVNHCAIYYGISMADVIDLQKVWKVFSSEIKWN